MTVSTLSDHITATRHQVSAGVGGLVGSCSVTFVRSVDCRHGPLVPLLADIVILTITVTLTMVQRGGVCITQDVVIAFIDFTQK